MNQSARGAITPCSIRLELNLYTAEAEDLQVEYRVTGRLDADPEPLDAGQLDAGQLDAGGETEGDRSLDPAAIARGELPGVAASPVSTPLLSGGITADTWQSWFHTWLNTLTWDEMPYLERAIAAGHGWLGGMKADGAIACELSLQLIDDDAIHDLNATYRQVDHPTDVLAFAALETPLPPLPPISVSGPAIVDPVDLGDIAISLDTAARQADERGHPLTVELAWLAAHGLLHLLGWDHPDADSLAVMLACQDRLLQAIGLTAAV